MSFVFEVVDTVVSPVLDVVSDIGDVVMDSPVFDTMDFVRDEIAAPVFDVVQENIDIYDAINIGITIASGGTIPPWVIGVSSGVATIARGGDLSDAIKAGAISYAGSTIGKTFDTKIAPKITDTLAAEGFNQTVTNLINEGVKSSAKALVYGQDPLKAFATGGLTAGVNAALGQIDEAFTNLTGEFELDEVGEFKLDDLGQRIPMVAGWENLQDGVKDAIAAGVTAELNGGSVDNAVLANIVSKYSGLARNMNNFLQSEEGLGLDEDRARLLTTALGNAAGAAVSGNSELTFDAFFKTIEDYGYKGLKEAIDKPVYEGLDKLTGDYGKTATAANALNTAIITAQDTTDEYNSLRTALQNEVDNAQALYGTAEYDAAYARLQERYDTYYTPTFDALQSEYDTAVVAVRDAQIEYDDQSRFLMSDLNDLDSTLSPLFDDVQLQTVLALKPDANLKVIANYLGVDEADAANAMLSTSGGITNVPNTQSQADAALNQARLQYVTAALNARGIPIESLSPNQLGKYLNYAKEFLGNTNDILSLDMNEFADSMIYSAELSPEIVKAAKDAGFVPEKSLSTLGVSGTTRGYEQFLEGTYIRFEKEGSPPEFLDTRGGWTPDSIIQRLEREGYTENDITHVGDGAYERFKDDFNDHRWLGKTSLEDLSDAVSNFRYLEDPMQTPGTRVLDEVVLGEGVGAQQLLDGSAILTNNDGVPTWELRTTQDTAAGGVDTTAVLEQAFTGTNKEDMVDFEGYVETSGGALFNPEDEAYARSKLQIATLATMNPNEGQTYDEFTNSSLYKTTSTLYNAFRDTFSEEENKDILDNTVSVVVGASGEMLQAIAGLATLVDNNPNNALGQTAKNMLRLSGDMRSDEWTAAAQEMATNSANYDAQWRKDNPGKEPTTIEKISLKTQAIYGNFKNHPAQFLAENVASEVLQELPILLTSFGVGNVAKAALVKAGKENAKRLSTKAALSTALTLDTAEAFGGTAASTFDEVYATALRTGKSEQEATDLALDTAQKAGTIASLATIFTATTMGGQSLAKSVLGDNAGSIGKNAFEALYDVVLEGTRVTIKEGITESIEEGLPQLYSATVQKQLDPNFDVAGSVSEASIMGTIAGTGTASTIYTGNVVADVLSMVNSDVENVFANTSTAEEATTALQELGLNDNVVLNNILNTTYDTMYVSTNEAETAFATANPNYIPTQDEINSFVTTPRSDADLATEISSYINERYTSVDDVIAAAEDEGITLTEDQIDDYVGEADPDTLAPTTEELRERIRTDEEQRPITELKEDVTQLGTDIVDTETRLTDLITTNEEAGLARDQATQTALDTLADQLGITEAELLAEIGTTKSELQADVTGLTSTIGDVGTDVQAIAELIGKPARDVTETDVDFVIDLLAQEDVLTEQQTQQYDVTGDSLVNQLDVDLLQQVLSGDTDVQLADTSMFTPATGLFADVAAQRDVLTQIQEDAAVQNQAELDAVTDLSTNINTQINAQKEQQAMRDFLQMQQLGLFQGARTETTSPDPLQLSYAYDIGGESVFATPQQEALFTTPYGDPRGSTRFFTQGGQINTSNDMLLKLLGEA